jgi:hypothetical protein
MRGKSRYAITALVAIMGFALIAAGCGGGDDTTAETTAETTSASAGAQQRVDEAVQSCNQEAEQLGGTAAVTLQGACKLVGTSAQQALKQGGAKAQQALSQAASSCRTAVGQLPSTEAQDALKNVCDAIAGAE